MPAWHWVAFGSAAVLSALLSLAIRRYVLATGRGLSVPRARDVHTKATPRLGGVAVSLSFFSVCAGVYLWDSSVLTLIPQAIWGIDRNLLGIFVGAILLMGVGIYDDLYGIKPLAKLAFHFLAGAILVGSSVLVSHITNPFGGQILLGSLSALFVVLWIVFMINVLNFLDGLDGLATGVSLIATIVLYLLAVKPEVHQYSMSVLAIIMAGALAGFLPFNFYPAKIFLGDSGSQVLGFLLGVFAIISGGKLATAFLVLGVPILDVIWVIARRVLTRQPVYKADRFHLHHRLLAAGLNQKQAVLLLYTISAAFGIIALQTQSLGKFIAAMLLIAIMVIGGVVLVTITATKTKEAK